MTITATDSNHLVGHRLIRRIGAGERAELFLAAPDHGGEGVALKVFRPAVTLDSIGNELAALGRARLPHVVRLDDVATGPDGRPIAILRRLPRASLARIVTERDAIELGEAVTALAPIVSTVSQLHRVGVVHSSLGPSSVLFGARGEPVLIGFGRAKLIETGLSIAALDEIPAVVAERVRLARFVAGGLERARPGDAQRAVRDLVGWLGDDRSTARFEFLEELEQRLFDLAVPVPITFSSTPVAVAVPSRVDRAEGDLSPSSRSNSLDASIGQTTATGATTSTGEIVRASQATRKDLRLAETLDRALQSSPRAVVLTKFRSVIGTVRRPFWIGLGVVAVLLATALSFVPAGNAATSRTVPTASPATGVSGSNPSPTSTPPDPRVQSNESQIAPGIALRDIMTRRAACFNDRSVGCLGSVDEAGSSALASDTASIRALQRGAEVSAIDSAAPNAQLVERIGDAAIVSVSKPGADEQKTSQIVLMMRSKAGWRIRDFFEPVAQKP